MSLGTAIVRDGGDAKVGMDFGAGKHVFELSGLGLAPYTWFDFDDKGGWCHYCRTSLRDRYWMRAADGKEFYVGRNCAVKHADAALVKVISRAERAAGKLSRERGIPLSEARRIELKWRRDFLNDYRESHVDPDMRKAMEESLAPILGEKLRITRKGTLKLQPRSEGGAGVVRQSFSHGRAKSVPVDKVRSRRLPSYADNKR